MAYFGDACTNCLLRTKCTTASGLTGAPSGSALTNKLSPAPASTRPNKPGATTIAPPVPRSNAISLISSTAGTEEGAPVCAAPPRSTPTSGYWPVPGTLLVSRALGSDGPLPGGRSSESARQREQTPAAAQPRVASGLASHGPPESIQHTGRDDSHTINNNPSIHTSHLVHAYLRVSSPNANQLELRAGNRSTS